MSSSVKSSIPADTSFKWSRFYKVSEVAGRTLLAALFLLAGIMKIRGYTQTAAYMASMSVPGGLLPLVFATEVLGSIAIIIGWKTRIAACLLAGFTLLAASIFHSNFADQIQATMFMKDVAIAGGFLMLVANGAGPLSIDYRQRANSANAESP